MTEKTQTEEPAVLAWRAVMSLVGWGSGRPPRIPSVAVELGLSPKQLALLWRLEPETTLSMREIGENLYCDASFVTGLVDKLEDDGLIERRSDPGDRRVTLVALTGSGTKLRERALELIYEPPPEFESLTLQELEQLSELLQKALTS